MDLDKRARSVPFSYCRITQQCHHPHPHPRCASPKKPPPPLLPRAPSNCWSRAHKRMFISGRKCWTVFQTTVYCYSDEHEIRLLTLQQSVSSTFCILYILEGAVTIRCCLICISLMKEWYLVCFLFIFFNEVLINILCLFLSVLVGKEDSCLLTAEYFKIFLYFVYRSLTDMFWNYFVPVCGLSFYFLNGALY